jgi:hypothetical protein
MGRPLYTNNAATYLAFGITNTATTMQVSANAGSLFPNPTGGDYFYVSLISLSGPIIEIVKCTSRSGDVFTIERGQEGTTPLYWNMGDNVQLRITAAGMNYIAGSTASTTLEQSFTATQGQTVFTLTNFDYSPGNNNLAVFVNGSKQVSGTNYTETNVNTVTFTTGLNAGDIVEFLSNLSVAAGTIYATDINYNEGSTGAVTRTLESKLQESVSVMDFGAVCNGTTDDTAAVQTAVNYCIANNKNLIVPGMCLLTSSVNIDRQVDGAAFDNYFIISSSSGGGFIVNTAIPMFSSSIAFTNSPVTQLTKFENLIFQSTDSSLSAYVLNEGRFLRTSFDNCSFDKIKLLSATVSITQSIYLNNCNIRRFTGNFFYSNVYTYDFKFTNCLVEAGTGTAIKIKNPIGCAFIGSNIEGMSGTAISYDGAQALDVTGCYFESNGLDIDGTYGGASTSNSYGVCLNGNYFSHSNSTYSVVWGQLVEGVSIGNFHNYNMHNLTTSPSNLITYDFALGSLCNTTINIISSGYTGSFAATLTGCTTSPSANFTYNKNGNTVTLFTPIVTGTSNSSGTGFTGLPAILKPINQQIVVCRVINNSVVSFGLLIVNTDGTISLASDAGGSGFVTAGTKGISVNTITYSLN